MMTTYLIVSLSFSVGFLVGGWWATRPEPRED